MTLVLAPLRDDHGSAPLFALLYMRIAVASCFRLLWHCTFLAASRALLSVGRRMDMSRAMMPMTTSSSTSVNPVRRDFIEPDIAIRTPRDTLPRLKRLQSPL